MAQASNANFREQLKISLDQKLKGAQALLESRNTLRIDLHCHDRNSDVPDELWGRILRLPETWLKPKELLKTLRNNGTDLQTITNHNNARSCWQMQDKGHDILSGAEFTCLFPEYQVWIHVLVYGFDPSLEARLLASRRDIYQFVRLCREFNLGVVQPHPLYFYSKSGQPPMEIFEKCAILFENFEVLNGQREIWQNHVTWDFVASLNAEKIQAWEKKHQLNSLDFCQRPYQKALCGGSDDHFGVFAGRTGTLLEIPHLEERLSRGDKKSELALEALLEGRTSPYGRAADEEKLTAAFLDYFAQCTLNAEDPGLIRMLLHSGSLEDKLYCLGISNGLAELRRHKTTTRFLEAWSGALKGEKPGLLLRMGAPKNYQPIIQGLVDLAKNQKKHPEASGESLKQVFAMLSNEVGRQVVEQAKNHWIPAWKDLQGDHEKPQKFSLEKVIEQLEVPSHLRTLFGKKKKSKHKGFHLGQSLDSLRFPALMGAVLGAAMLGSTRSLFAARSTIEQVAAQCQSPTPPKRWLWLSDTLEDRNGVSHVLKEILAYVQKHDLPIDFLVCSDKLQSEDHLIVVKPVGELSIPGFESQVFRIPDLAQVHRTFMQGSYSEILCSTEMCMGPLALFLKHAFHVPAHFYMHTDWMSYLENNTQLDEHGLNRIRRILRSFYQQFDQLLVLNSEHKAWLCSDAMGIPAQRILSTAHWPSEVFRNKPNKTWRAHPDRAPVLLYSGRLSWEKGLRDVVQVWNALKVEFPNCKMRFAGTGPAEAELRLLAADAEFLGWLSPEELKMAYGEADLLLFPSRFDTFGCSVLEAMSQGLPVIAYASKGPADLIHDGVSGFLCEDVRGLTHAALEVLGNPALLQKLRKGALVRAAKYTPDQIMGQFCADLGIPT